MKLLINRSSRVRREENPITPDKSLTRRRLTAQIRHYPDHDHLLDSKLDQVLLETRVVKRTVRVLLHDLVWFGYLSIDLWDEFGVGSPVDDQVAVPPLAEHGGVSSKGFVDVAREEYVDGGASADVDGGESVVEDRFGHGGEVVL